MKNGGNGFKRTDFDAIAGWIRPGSRVLDLGCGDGVLLKYLKGARDITGYGVEIDDANVLACVTNGVNVIQSDLERGLSEFETGSFDYVILSQTIQATRRPRWVLEQMLRIGKHVIVSFPNFGHWRIRFQLLRRGRMPITDRLNDSWYDTQNIHFCTIRDFVELVNDVDAKIERGIALDRWGRPVRLNAPWEFWNFFGEQGLFLLTRKG